MRAGIQNVLTFRYFPGFPFDASTLLSIDPEPCRRVDFAQGGESFDLAQDRELAERPVEPWVSPTILELARNDSFVGILTQLIGGRSCFIEKLNTPS